MTNPRNWISQFFKATPLSPSSLIWVLVFTVLPAFAQTSDSQPDLPLPSQTQSLSFVTAPFDLLTFASNLTISCPEAADKTDPKQVSDAEKLEKLKSSGFFDNSGEVDAHHSQSLKGQDFTCIPGQLLKRDPFDFWYFNNGLYLIDPKNPTQAVFLGSDPGYRNSEEQNPNIPQADEVPQILVENNGPDQFRVFLQYIGGNGHYGGWPRTQIWDLDFTKKTTVRFNPYGDFSFACDVEKTGHKDLVLCAIDAGGLTGAEVLSWDGTTWVDISAKEQDFIQGLMRNR